MKKLWFVVLALGLLSSCTEQQMARNYGGTATLDLPAGKKLVTATWKEDHLWYLLRDQKPGEEPETLTFHESSSLGVWQGTVVFKEH